MPVRNYRCLVGHEFEIYESMDEPPITECIMLADLDEECGAQVERQISKTSRPIVKGGTKLHHGTRGVE